MSQTRWTEVDRYFEGLLAPPDPILDAALAANRAAGLPAHDVSPGQGKLLHLLARGIGARRVLEIGTLGGYSTIWLARALPADGHLVTLEVDPGHAAVAAGNLARAGLAGVVEVRVGRAAESLAELAAGRPEPFDLVFIDADKANNPEYFACALALCRTGSLIVVDNVVRDGAVTDPDSPDASVRGVRRLAEMLSGEDRIEATAVQTVGSKGWDGFVIALVTADPRPSTRIR